MPNLEKDEKELLRSIEAGEWKSVDSKDSKLKRYQQYARSTLKKLKEGE